MTLPPCTPPSPLQAHGSPGAFWESEQESLLFVIEMKSERVQEQSRKLQHMDTLVSTSPHLTHPPSGENHSPRLTSCLSAGGEEPGASGPDGPRPAAERGPESSHRQLPGAGPVRGGWGCGGRGVIIAVVLSQRWLMIRGRRFCPDPALPVCSLHVLSGSVRFSGTCPGLNPPSP